MDKRLLSRLTGASALVGGLLLGLWAVLAARMPLGCVGDDECAVRAMRSTEEIDGYALVGVLLLLAALVGILVLIRRAGRFGRSGAAGVTVVALAVVVLLAGSSVARDGRDDLMPWFVVPGVLGMFVGLVLVGIQIVRSHVLPTWMGWALMVGGALIALHNEQNTAVLFLLPVAVAWLAIGVWLLLRAGQTDALAGPQRATR